MIEMYFSSFLVMPPLKHPLTVTKPGRAVRAVAKAAEEAEETTKKKRWKKVLARQTKRKKNENQDIKISVLPSKPWSTFSYLFVVFVNLCHAILDDLCLKKNPPNPQSKKKNPSSSHPYPYSLICPYLWLSFLQTPIPIHFWPRTLASLRSSRSFFSSKLLTYPGPNSQNLIP